MGAVNDFILKSVRHELRVLVLGLVIAGCGTQSRTIQETPVPVPTADTALGVGDTFDVRIYGEPDLSGTYRVGADGGFSFPLVGAVQVVGLEPQAVAKVIAERLRQGILRDPQVSVLVREQTSKKIYVLGQVSKPGTFGCTPSMNVLEAITAAGGFTNLAAKNDTTITRSEQGSKTVFKVPVAEIGEGRARNVYIRPGDIINVPERLF